MKLMRLVLVCALCLALCLGMAAPTFASSSDETIGFGQTTTVFNTEDQMTNISLAVWAIDGYTLEYGDRFSFNDVVGPRTSENGFVRAKNGRGAKVTGGGVSQVATTILLALEDSDWFEVEKYLTYGDRFTAEYITDASKAVVTDYSAGHDLAFTSNYPGTIEIQAQITKNAVRVELAVSGGSSSESDGIVMGTTPLPSESGQLKNVRRCVELIDGYILSYGDTFSFNDVVGPRTKEAGFVSGTNGRGVKVTGGGAAQVASTIYLAAKGNDDIVIDPFKTYGSRYTGTYVNDPEDAIVTDYSAGTDFSFTYYGSGMLMITFSEFEGWLYCYLTE